MRSIRTPGGTGGRSVAVSAGLLFSLLGLAAAANAQIPATQNSLWKVVTTGSGQAMTDPFLDQQTGSPEGDLVGNAANPLLYSFFDPGTTASLTDGTFYFRVRVGQDGSPAGFKSSLLVGIDANADGKIDLFAGVDNSGNPNVLRLWDPGNSANTGPNNSSFSAAPKPGGAGDYSYTETTANYNFSSATSLDSTASVDVNGDTQPDYFLTFGVPFQDMVDRLNVAFPTGGRPTAISINEKTNLRFSVATTQNSSNINQDANGLAKLGTLATDVSYAYTDPFAPTAFQLPESPSGALLLAVALPGVLAVAWSRRNYLPHRDDSGTA